MLATPGTLPEGPEWMFEVKWDGVRVLVDVVDGALRITGADGDVTASFPELAGLIGLAPDVLIDGEVVLLEGGVPSFAALAERVAAPPEPRVAAAKPVTLMAFDVLRLYGVDLLARPWHERRATLERMAIADTAAVTLSPVYTDGQALLDATVHRGMEGIVAKRRDGAYRPGEPSADWVTVTRRETLTCVVGGWRPRRTGGTRIGTLLLGVPDGDRLRYAGKVMFAGATAERLLGAKLVAAPVSPFGERLTPTETAGVRWCEPKVAVEITHRGWSGNGRLRQPVFRRVRDDPGHG
ncbi:DNA ligase [Pseudonocardia sp. GCM10023141]|uniref:ATP-dependent DNA ligase n=1 Tax=Pseudonocardia sp. GCM10023141 TaxID=3252653 RepID=UPI003606512F